MSQLLTFEGLIPNYPPACLYTPAIPTTPCSSNVLSFFRPFATLHLVSSAGNNFVLFCLFDKLLLFKTPLLGKTSMHHRQAPILGLPRPLRSLHFGLPPFSLNLGLKPKFFQSLSAHFPSFGPLPMKIPLWRLFTSVHSFKLLGSCWEGFPRPGWLFLLILSLVMLFYYRLIIWPPWLTKSVKTRTNCFSSFWLYLWAAEHKMLSKRVLNESVCVCVCLIHLCLTLVAQSLMNEKMILYAVSSTSCPQSPYVPRVWFSMLFLEFHLIRHTPARIHIGLALFSVVTSSVLWAEKTPTS